MALFFSKITKIGLLALLPLFPFSNYSEDVPLGNQHVPEGRYSLILTGVENKDLKVAVVFETSVKNANSGISLSTLILKLVNEEGVHPHSMEFLDITMYDRWQGNDHIREL